MKKIFLTIFLLLMIGGSVLFVMKMTSSTKEHIHHAGESQKQIYYCPMHPNYTSDRPGNCPICGMTLVVKKVKSEKLKVKSEEGEIFISTEKQQLIGVKTDTVKFLNLQKTIRAKGIVEYDERRVFDVNTKFEGWIERLFVNYTGQFVNKGEPLFTIYSPELVSAQQEYLLAIKSRDTLGESGLSEVKRSSNELILSARRKLKLWDITNEQIKELEKTGEAQKTLTVYSPYSGFVIEKMMVEGMKVMPGEALYKIVDTSVVWILADIYEQDIPFIKLGQTAKISLANRNITGKISYIEPHLEQEIRTAKVRVELANPDFLIKPHLYADVEIAVDLGKRLAVKETAVIDTGERQIAIIASKDGHFKPVEVKLGSKVEDYYEVLSGLNQGDTVVTNANFLIDSESRMKEAMRGMTH